MPWSKAVLKKISAQKTVLEFIPQKFELGTPSQALDYLNEKKQGSDFRMNDVIRVQTGVDKIEESDVQRMIEERAIGKLKEIQEEAYKAAYQLGLDEGKNKAFEHHSQIITNHIVEMDKILSSLTTMKKDIFNANENHLMQLMFAMATKIAQHQLEISPEALIEVIRNAVSLAQDEEEIHVQVSKTQFEFISNLKNETSREFEFMKKIKFEANAEIQAGGCLVETNFGEVDSRVEQRVALLWENLKENLPRIKIKLVGNS